MLERIIYHIGRYSKSVRYLYYKFTGGKWLWGIIGYIRDKPKYKETPTKLISKEEFDKIIEHIFDYEK